MKSDLLPARKYHTSINLFLSCCCSRNNSVEYFYKQKNAKLPFILFDNVIPNEGGGVIPPPHPLLPRWFSLDNSETVKAVTLVFCSI